MAINQDLFGKLRSRLELSRARVYKLIQDIELSSHVSPHVASLMLAGQNGIPYGKYATAEDRVEIRSASGSFQPLPQERPVQQVSPIAAAPSRSPKATRNNSIFVVHGRDAKLTQDMYSFLRAIGLNAMEWDDAIKAAKGGANPIVGDVITNAMKKAQGVLVLLSPDEDAKLKNKFASERDKKKGLHKLETQPRPNVIFEAGLALGAHSDKTILVQVGDIRDISDIAGKHMVHLTDSPQSRKNLALRLQDKLKFRVNLTGNDWLEVGQFNRK
jgi:predicted nucleotide-binding protein